MHSSIASLLNLTLCRIVVSLKTTVVLLFPPQLLADRLAAEGPPLNTPRLMSHSC